MESRIGPGSAVRMTSVVSPLAVPRTPAPSLRSSSSSSGDSISLNQPRPDVERVTNEYIDTPLKGGIPLHAETHPHVIHIGGSPHDHLALVSPLGKSPASATPPPLKRLHSRRSLPPVTKQPECTTTTTSSVVVVVGGGDSSIICPECSRCRCQSCRTPRLLPSRWLCGDKCLCSAESCVDYVSCLCCVKGLFYHCVGDEDDDEQRRRCGTKDGGGMQTARRWGCLASLSLVLPCLLCYWPLRGGVKVAELCYQKCCTRHGCRCQSLNSSSNSSARIVTQQPSGSKRLLDS